jgi:hypothetical protein
MDHPQEDFKWFGEGFDGFPKRLPDDTVEYSLFVIDGKLSETQIASRLRSILQSSSALTKDLLKGYIWQREAFSLELTRKDGRPPSSPIKATAYPFQESGHFADLQTMATPLQTSGSSSTSCNNLASCTPTSGSESTTQMENSFSLKLPMSCQNGSSLRWPKTE